MAKGIRPAVNAKFVELSPKRLAGEFGAIDTPLAEGNTKFRANVIQFAIDTFTISLASAATAYNKAKQVATEAHPELVVGLGRPEDKKGGRKPGSTNAAPVTVPEGEAAAETPAAETPVEPAVPAVDAVVETVVETPAAAAEVAVVKIKVTRVKDGEVVAEVDTMEEAQALVDKAAKAKKAKLQIVA